METRRQTDSFDRNLLNRQLGDLKELIPPACAECLGAICAANSGNHKMSRMGVSAGETIDYFVQSIGRCQAGLEMIGSCGSAKKICRHPLGDAALAAIFDDWPPDSQGRAGNA